MRKTKSKTLCVILMGLALRASGVSAQSKPPTIMIDGEHWMIIKSATMCDRRAEAAIRRYREVPIYRIEREVIPERYFVNESTDCWIELYVEGVDDAAVIFKVSEDGVVIDERIFSYWGPSTYPYPQLPYPVHPD